MVMMGRQSIIYLSPSYILQFMKKTFYINNYLNQKAPQPVYRGPEESQIPQNRPQKLDYYEQYLEKYNLQHSESAQPYPQPHPHSPIKRTTTAHTDFTHHPITARQEHPRKSSDDTQKSLTTQRLYEPTNHSPSPSPSVPPSGKSERQLQLQLELNINKLKDIKSFLENEISMLQQLLDETSRGLPNIDLQYEKIKERVISFTARSLDAAFRKYKQGMARWSKYQEVEKKGLEVVLEMRDYIRERERLVQEVRHGGSVPPLANQLREMGNRVEHYQSTSNQLRRMKEECLGKHPTLREEKVLEFERALAELCSF